MKIIKVLPEVDLAEELLDEIFIIENSCVDDPTPYWDTNDKAEFLEYTTNNINFLAINEYNKIVGYLTLERDGKKWHIGNLAIHRDYRRQGIGEDLINEVKKHIMGPVPIKLEILCATYNIPAISLYKKLGFDIIETKKEFYKDNSNAYLMQRIV